MLSTEFRSIVSVNDYCNIVACLREYDRKRDPVESEKYQLNIRGWPETYHPCDQMENIRWAFGFGGLGTKQIEELLNKWKTFDSKHTLVPKVRFGLPLVAVFFWVRFNTIHTVRTRSRVVVVCIPRIQCFTTVFTTCTPTGFLRM